MQYDMHRAPEHPLAMKDGRVYTHRAMLYDRIGHGPHQCHWCKRQVDWSIAHPRPGALLADHLDGDRWNNASSNLVPSCGSCNAGKNRLSLRHLDVKDKQLELALTEQEV